MTGLSLSHPTQTAPFDSLIASHSSLDQGLDIITNGVVGEEEEDYTIKCICGFQEDDGKTVFCEKCETWQHILCFYPDNIVPDIHLCADCEPRSLDSKKAKERQKKFRGAPEPVEQKLPKKPISKSHKKKPKPSETQSVPANGLYHDRAELASPRHGSSGSPRDQQPPSKRPKTSHRSSNSFHAQKQSHNSTAHSDKRSSSASNTLESPSKTPTNSASNGYHSRPYSIDFIHLYEDDPGDAPLQANLFNDIAITSSLSQWSQDTEALAEAANGRTPQDIFLRCEQSLDSMPLPPLNKQSRKDETVEMDGQNPTWIYLTIDTYAQQNTIVGELRGKIGHMQDYVHDPLNRWEYLRHPLPFVFFHPSLPIYIDTRNEGTTLRYLRRSCRPNLSMKTILENGSEYHFCFIANQDLEAGAELTIAWTLDEHVRTFLQQKNDVVKQEGAMDTSEGYVTDWVGKVLADFGGCACEGREECSMAIYDRRNGMSSVSAGNILANGKSKKGRNNAHHVSSTNTGRATNSRSGSEVIKQQDDDDQDDNRSTSGSSRSKSNSRVMTPSSGEKGAFGGLEISDREKRKIAALESKDQVHNQPATKKKKRNSGGSNHNTLSGPTVRTPGGEQSYAGEHFGSRYHGNSASLSYTPGIISKPRYVDTGTYQRQSGSPISKSPLVPITTSAKSSHTNSPIIPSPLTRPQYVDASMQTDPDPNDVFVFDDINPPPKRKPFIPFTKQLLMRCHKERVKLNEARDAFLKMSTNNNDKAQVSEITAIEEIVVPDAVGVDVDATVGTGVPKLSSPSLSLNPPIEKPRPPDDMRLTSDKANENLEGTGNRSKESEHDQTSVDKILPNPQAWPTPPNAEEKQTANGFRTIDLHVEPPLKTTFFAHPATPNVVNTPTSVGASIGQSPTIQTPSCIAPSMSNASSLTNPSPAKKKLSLSEYVNRLGGHKEKAETPTSILEGSSPVLAHVSMKLSESFTEQAGIHGTEGSVLLDTPKLEDGDPMDTTNDMAAQA